MFKFSIFLVFVMIFSTPVFSKDNKKSAYKNINIKTQKNKASKKQDSNIMEGKLAHPFTLMSTKRRFKSLKKIVALNKDKDIFLIFFTTSCKSCVKERTKIIEMAKKDKRILPILIGVRNPKDETITEFNKTIKDIIKKENIKHDVFLDLYGTVAKFYKVKEGTSITVPKLFIVNSNTGKIVKIISGYDDNLPNTYKNLYKNE